MECKCEGGRQILRDDFILELHRTGLGCGGGMSIFALEQICGAMVEQIMPECIPLVNS